eukprot:Polyplicarium_translucidae@DN3148_c0_g1_i1.p1
MYSSSEKERRAALALLGFLQPRKVWFKKPSQPNGPERRSALNSKLKGEGPACCFFLQGKCSHGESCVFWHPKTPVHQHKYLVCKYGRQCGKNHGSHVQDADYCVLFGRFIYDALNKSCNNIELAIVVCWFMAAFDIDIVTTHASLLTYMDNAPTLAEIFGYIWGLPVHHLFTEAGEISYAVFCLKKKSSDLQPLLRRLATARRLQG